jgi:hypothetical protein
MARGCGLVGHWESGVRRLGNSLGFEKGAGGGGTEG